MKHVIVVGLDGLSWNILNMLSTRGLVRNITSIKKEGTNSEHRSLIPPFTVPTWTSLSTGVNPGKHGAYSFFLPKEDYTSKVSSSRDVDYPRIYELCALQNLNSIVINLPLSYPPIILKGIMISDWLYPTLEVYPKKEENLVKDYIPVNPRWVKHNPEAYLKEMQRGLETRLHVIKKIFLTKEWNLFFVVFSETDFLFHKFYHDIFTGKKVNQKIDNIFGLLDDFIGWVKKNIPSESLLLIVSDHGFKEYKRIIHVNMLLKNLGLAKSRPIMPFLYRYPKLYNTIRKTLFTFIRHDTLTQISREYSSAFDIKSSHALMHTHTHSGVYLNSKDIFHNALLDEAETEATRKKIHTILTTKIDKKGKKIFQKLYTREQLFQGPHVKHFPHIIFFPHKKNWFDHISRRNSIEEKSYIGHNPGGIFLAYGDDIKYGVTLNPISIYDITPTILHYLGLPIPHNTDGRVLYEILSDNSLIKHEIVRQKNYFLKWNLIKRAKFAVSK